MVLAMTEAVNKLFTLHILTMFSVINVAVQKLFTLNIAIFSTFTVAVQKLHFQPVL